MYNSSLPSATYKINKYNIYSLNCIKLYTSVLVNNKNLNAVQLSFLWNSAITTPLGFIIICFFKNFENPEVIYLAHSSEFRWNTRSTNFYIGVSTPLKTIGYEFCKRNELDLYLGCYDFIWLCLISTFIRTTTRVLCLSFVWLLILIIHDRSSLKFIAY